MKHTLEFNWLESRKSFGGHSKLAGGSTEYKSIRKVFAPHLCLCFGVMMLSMLRHAGSIMAPHTTSRAALF